MLVVDGDEIGRVQADEVQSQPGVIAQGFEVGCRPVGIVGQTTQLLDGQVFATFEPTRLFVYGGE